MTNLFVNVDRYVYFDEAGEILAIRNSNTSEGNYINVNLDEIRSLIVGTELLNNYIVIFDTVTKSNVLRHKFVEEEVQFDINNQIYQIPTKDVIRPDFVIQQNITERKWKIKLDPVVKSNLDTQTVNYDTPIALSITIKNDPHRLERYIIVALKDLVKQDYEFDFESELELDPTGISVYTTKRLETYYHEVLE